VNQLREANQPVRALTRRPDTVALPDDVEVVAGDLTVPESLDQALDGVRTVFLVWATTFATAADVLARLAERAERVVLLSSPHQTPHPFFQQPNPLATHYAQLEQRLADSGLDLTIVRPGMFAANTIAWWAPQIRQGDVVRWPYGAVETAPIDERDIAAVVVHALLGDERVGRDVVVTGPESLSQAAQVHAIGRAIGRTLRFHELSPDEFRRGDAGPVPGPVADMLLAAWGAAAGLPAYVTSAVAEVTGRPARTFDDWAAANASAFDGPPPADRR
jgi:uncharacterized protein YbjT (DUF2867 family)